LTVYLGGLSHVVWCHAASVLIIMSSIVLSTLGYQSALAKFTLKKFLLLILFLDKAKTAHLIGYNPCLFCKDSDYKVCAEYCSLLLYTAVTEHIRSCRWCVM